MNIYKTQDGTYINMNRVAYVKSNLEHTWARIIFDNDLSMIMMDDQAKSFLDYLDRRLNTVFEGYA